MGGIFSKLAKYWNIYLTVPEDGSATWIQNRRSNMETSPLYQVPIEILVMIRDFTDSETRQVMRYTSGLPMQVVAGLDLVAAMQDPKPRTEPSSYDILPPLIWPSVWPLHGTNMERGRQRDNMKKLLDRDTATMSCPDCCASQATGCKEQILSKFTSKTAWCSGCRKDHPLVLFSYVQRKLPLNSNRICIGREGAMSLASQTAISWNQLARAPKSRLVKEILVQHPW
ncbi:hypothetical protein QBC38DRAFT_480163 [Podospora fimiseda]|uniref:Uncharacterized protein n=1 Tax=Podospora fimiseda TaxID=252190 RepID=A0AAN7GXT0_9PEZI|nr:hypothetical protein QBC38DRAFT_480163 [Podospora fimiseda]